MDSSQPPPAFDERRANPPLRLGAVVLAAGASTRMGRPKQLLLVGGQPMLLHTVDAVLASVVWPVVVVLGAHAGEIRPLLVSRPVLIVENPAWAEGMASSIRVGVEVLQQFSRSLDGALITLCDQPGLTTDVIAQLIAAQQTSGRTIAAAHYSGRLGAPALFLRSHFTALRALTGEEGARALLNAHPDDVTSVDLPALAQDLDTPDDYRAVQRS